MRVLVTGGAGYIGSHAVRELLSGGHQVFVLDDLSRGHRAAVDRRAHFQVGSTGDFELVKNFLRENKIEIVMHFAAFMEVAESVLFPEKYYENNYKNTLELLRAMREAHVHRLVFSSTAAVYGSDATSPIVETEIKKPINPYGDSKSMAEEAILKACQDYGLGYTIFRYFNLAGAHPDGTTGEDHRPESHLIPRILQSLVNGRAEVSIYGTDYPTVDGSCVRDYVHVMDIANAHVLAMPTTFAGKGSIYNLGSQNGFSVHQIIASCEKVTQLKINALEGPRRAGDPATLVADSTKAREILNWAPRYSDIDTMISHAWAWHKRHPNGYPD